MEEDVSRQTPAEVELPAPTAWPIVLAFGATLLFAGLLTSADLSIAGAVLMVVASMGWFRDVLPHERHEMVPVEAEAAEIVTARPEVVRAGPEMQRLRIPVEIYPVTAGIKGGLAGGVAMAVLAGTYGVLSHGSVWYPINLLAAVVQLDPMPRVVVVGSSDEYGRPPGRTRRLNEATPLQPVTPYGVSKVTQDLLALQYHLSHGLPAIRLRPFNHAGPRQAPDFAIASARWCRSRSCWRGSMRRGRVTTWPS